MKAFDCAKESLDRGVTLLEARHRKDFRLATSLRLR